MVTTDSVKRGIEAGLACEHVEVIGDGQHFQALIVSREFEGRGRVQRHQ
ncbi:MAG TPA: BolA/IbaG family iron-sulfur metabolism protein, partial [Burkholderiales bacterium]|nr:BolA/IbaG family iron-sulfur metabolism protein [Burkholderiales bacterium]